MGDLALAQVAELLLRCASERRRLEGDTLHCWVTRQDLATHLEETGKNVEMEVLVDVELRIMIYVIYTLYI